jgi:translation initiation factor 2B subunit (eIF-2B alpha/beta/delta family)
MTKHQKERLNKILNDKTSGSTEILLSLNRFLKSGISNRTFIDSSLIQAKKMLSHFAAINNYINILKHLINEKDFDKVKNYLNSIESLEDKKFESICAKIQKEIPKATKILTISRSGTLISIFKLWHQQKRKLKLIIPESRPSNEGKLMAKELVEAGIKVEMITDAMTGKYISGIDAVIIGADAVLKNGNVINKSGSLSLAVLCKHFKKPFYVLATKSKLLNKIKYKIECEDPEKVWDYKHLNLETSNIPFEEIDSKLITKIITE